MPVLGERNGAPGCGKISVRARRRGAADAEKDGELVHVVLCLCRCVHVGVFK